jgi:quercetin dioxygenase-like cupin family protein
MFHLFRNQSTIVESTVDDLYQYRVFIGKHQIVTAKSSSYWFIDNNQVVCKSGDGSILDSDIVCTEIYGYTPEQRSSTFSKKADLPYINGCSTKQLIPPVRPGDPTFQLLVMPPNTSEQEHHIHATARVVYVYKGSGTAIVGSADVAEKFELIEGDVIILDKMSAHHFETGPQELIVIPLHIFSSHSSAEYDHPMFNGTHRLAG